MDSYNWLTQFMWQHPFGIGMLFFGACLLAVWLYGRRRRGDIRGQWMTLFGVCLLFQVTVSLAMVSPVLDEAKLDNMMRTYWRLGQVPNDQR